MINKCCYFHGVPSNLLQKVIRKFNHAKSLFQSKHHRPGSLYSYLTPQLNHHRQLQEVLQVYQFAQWPVTSCRCQIPYMYAGIKTRINRCNYRFCQGNFMQSYFKIQVKLPSMPHACYLSILTYPFFLCRHTKTTSEWRLIIHAEAIYVYVSNVSECKD